MREHLDVLIIGAGLSGICQGAYLRMNCPDLSFAMLEARERIGGTWDLFRYPGVRSDSDMFTFGFRFKPWTEGKDIASAASIRNYLAETVEEYRLAETIRFQHRVKRIDWSSAEARWLVDVERADGSVHEMSCGYVVSCGGYYNYEHGHRPVFEGVDDFQGAIAHPQHWPQDLDYAGKRVAIVGSGATAVTLAPTMAETAAHVTLIQRSPSYIYNRPAEDAVAIWARRLLPDAWAHKIARVKNILLGIWLYGLSQRKPETVKRHLAKMAKDGVGDACDVDVHFNPSYGPWDQRLCLIPDGDLFEAIKAKRVEMATDHIDRFTETGLRLKSGREIEADVIVPATGLEIQFLGGAEMSIDGTPVDIGAQTVYRGMMLSNVPNFTIVFGYSNASWTLKADLTCDYVSRLLNHMKRQGAKVARPVLEGEIERKPLISLTSGYLMRAQDIVPKQGATAPWKNHENYIGDMLSIRYGKFDDGVLELA